MIVVMEPGSSQKQVDHVVYLLDSRGVDSWVIEGRDQKAVEVLGDAKEFDRAALASVPMVERILENGGPILAAGRKPGDRPFEVALGNGTSIGGKAIGLIAGPCCVENQQQLLEG